MNSSKEIFSKKVERPAVIFIRGLHTQGLDHLNFGPFGTYSVAHAINTLVSQERPFLLIPKLLPGPIETVSDQVFSEIENFKRSENLTGPFHLLGHSMGGLVARSLAHRKELKKEILSLTTIASPHRGTPVARLAVDFSLSHRSFYKVLKYLGYDTEIKKNFFKVFLDAQMEAFNKKYPDESGIYYASSVTSCPEHDWSYPYKFFRLKKNLFEGESDGMVPAHSQEWGQILGRYRLDHITSLGIQPVRGPWSRASHQREFFRMVKDLLNHWSEIDQKFIAKS